MENIEQWRIRLKKIRKSKRITLQDVFKATGIQPPHLSNVEKGTKNFSQENWSKLLDYYGVQYEDVFDAENVSPAQTPTRVSRPIPVISWIQAGEMSEAIDSWPVGVSGEGEPVFASRPVGPNAFGLRVEGDSMWPRFHDGDVIVVDPDLECQTGHPCVVKVNDQVTFKMYHENGVEIRLRPLNPRYHDIVIPKDRCVDMKIVGRVMDVIVKF